MKPITPQQAINQIGHVAVPTKWMKVDQSMSNSFAQVTQDHQFIHVDPERAKLTPLKSTIAHVFLSLSLLTHFAKDFALHLHNVAMIFNYGFDKVRVITPARSGAETRAVAILPKKQKTNTLLRTVY